MPIDTLAVIESKTTVAMQRSWESLDESALNCMTRTAVDRLWILGRDAAQVLRNELVPALREVKRRYAAGQTIGSVGSLEAYIRSLGLNPSTVRSWDMREKNDEMLKQVLQEVFVDLNIPPEQVEPPKPIWEPVSSPPLGEYREGRKPASESAKAPKGKSNTKRLREWLQGKYRYIALRPSEHARCRDGRYELTLDGLTTHEVKIIGEVLGRFKCGTVELEPIKMAAKD